MEAKPKHYTKLAKEFFSYCKDEDTYVVEPQPDMDHGYVTSSDDTVLAYTGEHINKLGRLERLEEQRRLLVLPCAVGQIVYVPTRNFVSEYKITSVMYANTFFFNWKLISGIYTKLDGFPEGEIGRSVFLTRKEAKKATQRNIQEEDKTEKLKYRKTGSYNPLDEIDWGDGRILDCNAYWADDATFALDIGDGELTDADGEEYFLRCEYNRKEDSCVFEVWFENDSCNVEDILPEKRDAYLTEDEMQQLRAIVSDLAKEA